MYWSLSNAALISSLPCNITDLTKNTSKRSTCWHRHHQRYFAVRWAFHCSLYKELLWHHTRRSSTPHRIIAAYISHASSSSFTNNVWRFPLKLTIEAGWTLSSGHFYGILISNYNEWDGNAIPCRPLKRSINHLGQISVAYRRVHRHH